MTAQGNRPGNRDVRVILRELWALTGLDPAALASVQLTGGEPVLPSTRM